MSTRDKKLLVYFGAFLIIAVAYFFVGRPYLDKISVLSMEKMELENTLSEKRKAAEKQDEYIKKIAENDETIQKVMDKFPEDNTDEKAIMFASKAEGDIPIWFSQIKFADEIKMTIDGEEITADSIEEAKQQLEEAANSETTEGAEGEVTSEGVAVEPQVESKLDSLMWRRTDLGFSFQTKYDGFKRFLAYIRDYEDRIVIKEMEVTYDGFSGMVAGTMILSQHAILGDDRKLPEVETNVDNLGTNNVFLNEDNGGSILDLLSSLASDFIEAITGGLSQASQAADDLNTDYFIKLNSANDNTNGKTVGKADDVQGSTYVTSNSNSKEDISFIVAGEGGEYMVKYSIGDSTYTDSIEKSEDEKIYLRIVSADRFGDEDKVAASIRISNSSDIPVYVNVESDDTDEPRINIVERNGEVTVK